MDSSSESSFGQQNVTIAASTVAKIAQQCDSLQMLRAWYGHFEPTIRRIDATASVKAHDLIVDAVINARQVARELGISLPDVGNLNWKVTPRPDRPAVEF